MSVNSKMTAIANQIRNLSGSSSLMGLDAMANNIGGANNEIANQLELVNEITELLVQKTNTESFDEEIFEYTNLLSEQTNKITRLRQAIENKKKGE